MRSKRTCASTSPPTASSSSPRPPWPWARASPPATCSWRTTSSACRSSASACCRATPTAPTASAAPAAARSSPAARRCAWRRNARSRTARSSPPRRWRRRPATSSTHAGRFTVAGTDLGIGLFELAARQAARAAFRRQRQRHRRRAELAQRLPRLRGRDRPRHRRGGGRGLCLGQRHRPRRQPGHRARPDRGRRGAGHRPGAVRARRLRRQRRPAAVSASFMDYALPHADGFRGFKTAFDESVPCLTNVLGAKGVGELGTIGATPAVVNAVVDALAHAGPRAATPSACRCRSPVRASCGARCGAISARRSSLERRAHARLLALLRLAALLRDERGWLRPGDDWLRLFPRAARAGAGGRVLRLRTRAARLLLDAPTRPSTAERLARLKDADARENYAALPALSRRAAGRRHAAVVLPAALPSWRRSTSRRCSSTCWCRPSCAALLDGTRRCLRGARRRDCCSARNASRCGRPRARRRPRRRDLLQETSGLGEIGRMLMQAQVPLRRWKSRC